MINFVKDLFKKKEKEIPECIDCEHIIPFDEWVKEYNVGSRYTMDIETEQKVKIIKIEALQKYNKLHQQTIYKL